MSAGIPDIQPILDVFDPASGMLTYFLLAFARIRAMFVILPPITRLGLTSLQKNALSLAFALPALPMLQAHPTLLSPALLPLILLILKETAVGFVLGAAIALPFWAVETAAELIDQQRSSESAIYQDSANSESGITGTLFALTLCLLFFKAGGLTKLIQGFLVSYEIWPITRFAPIGGTATVTLCLVLFDRILATGFLLAGPLLAAMLLGEIGLALVGRIAPQLNVYDLSMAMKGLIFISGLPICAPLLIERFRDLLAPLLRMPAYLHGIAGP